MAGDKGSRRFVRFWWVLAFTLGAIAGAGSLMLAGLQYTAWWIVGVCGTLMAVTAIFESYGDGHPILPRAARRRWHPPIQRHQPPIGRGSAKPKDPVRRGRLRAINGKKIAEPPSGGGAP
jgi:hypothetical protein